MNITIKSITAVILAAGLTSVGAYAADATPPAKKHVKHAAKAAPAAAATAAELQELKREMESQINALKDQLSTKDSQLRQAQEAAAAAQAAAARAEAAANSQQQAVTENATAVGTLQATVADLKTNQTNLVTTVQDNQAQVKKAMESPDTLHFKGVTLTPGGFLAGETVFRTHATGGDIPTAFNALPYEHADAYSLSEFYGAARQSRFLVLAQGKTSWGTLRGYVEADFLGAGVTSNNNQTNSYVMRPRVIYAAADTNNHWTFAGGQLWSLAAEGKKGIVIGGSSDTNTPMQIDPNYVPGFVWARQYGFRAIKSFDKMAFAISAENPQILYSATLAGNTPYAVLGSAGNNGGNYNAAVSSCSPTLVKTYGNQVENGENTLLVNYSTVNACTNITNISFNVAPDILVKAAFDPGIGHYEIFGIGRFAHESVYPGETTNGNLYGGLTNIKTGYVIPKLTTAGSYVDTTAFGGFGASARVPLMQENKLSIGLKGLYGPGVGRYGDSTLSDATSNAQGKIVPLHNLSGIATVEFNATPRLVLWANYGGDYASRAAYTGLTLGAPTAGQNSKGQWGNVFKPETAAVVGYGSRLASNSSCLTTTNPGYNGSSTGYYTGSGCGDSTKDVQEITGGYWYDFYKGPAGRLRQGLQYGYAVREGWSGAVVTTNGPNGVAAKGIDNMVWTSFRYYLP